ncbi:MAG: FxLYD domain-containing protein [Nitrososphaerales archaeon]
MLRIAGAVIAVILLALAGENFGYSDEGIVRVLDHNMYTDTSGHVHIVGLIENNTDEPVGFVDVTANLFDNDGNMLPKYSAFALMRTIMPGGIGPFDIVVNDPAVSSKVASYSISFEWRVGEEKPDSLMFSDVKTYAVTHMDPSTFEYVYPHEDSLGEHMDPHAHSETSGSIMNSGDAHTKWVKVVVVWYDKEGNLGRVDWQMAKTRLAPGEEHPFVIMTHIAAGYYSLMAESNDYVTMLKNGSERVMPVYEAPKAAMPAKNAIDMREISFTDESNNPVSLLESGHQVQLISKIQSNLSTPQEFVCIFQVVDSDGLTVMLSWIASEISAGSTADISVSWIPESEGAYGIKSFLWQGMMHPIPLSGEADSLFVEVE